MSNDSDALVPLIEGLYEAVLDESRLLDGLSRVGKIINCTDGTLIGWNTAQKGAPLPIGFFSARPEAFSELWADYTAHYHQFDPSALIAGAYPDDGWFVDTRTMSRRERATNPMIQELFIPKGFAGWAVLEISNGFDTWALSFERENGKEEFAKSDLDRVTRVVPHIRRALVLRQRMARLRETSAIGLSALDLFALPVWILEGDGRILHCNRAANDLLDGGKGMLIAHDNRLEPRATQDRVVFTQLRVNAIAKSGKRAGVMRTSSAHGGGAILQVLPITPHLAIAGVWQRPLVMVTVHVNREPQLSETLRVFYELTFAEVRIAMALVGGATLAEIAERFAVRESTVRMQIKSVFAKTGCRRQAELVRLLGSLTAAKAHDAHDCDHPL